MEETVGEPLGYRIVSDLITARQAGSCSPGPSRSRDTTRNDADNSSRGLDDSCTGEGETLWKGQETRGADSKSNIQGIGRGSYQHAVYEWVDAVDNVRRTRRHDGDLSNKELVRTDSPYHGVECERREQRHVRQIDRVKPWHTLRMPMWNAWRTLGQQLGVD